MKNLLSMFWKDEDGATMIEYIIMIALMAGVILVISPALRDRISDWINDMFDNVTTGIDSDDMEVN